MSIKYAQGVRIEGYRWDRLGYIGAIATERSGTANEGSNQPKDLVLPPFLAVMDVMYIPNPS